MSQNKEPLDQQFPTQADVSHIYVEVLEYNRNHTGYGSIFGSVIAGVAAGGEVDIDSPEDSTSTIHNDVIESVEEKKNKSDMYGDLLTFTTDESMASIGLRLEPSGSYSSYGERRVSGREIAPHLDSPQRFADFLQTLTAEGVEQDEAFQKMADDIMQGQASIVKEVYTPDADHNILGNNQAEFEAEGENQLRAFSVIADSYEHLGLDERPAFKQMAEYVKRWGQGVLPDFLIAEKRAYLKPDIQGWGPATWQIDIAPGKLIERWDEAIDFVKYIRQDPSKLAFADEVQQALEASLKVATAWAGGQKAPRYRAEYLQQVDTDLQVISERFASLEA